MYTFVYVHIHITYIFMDSTSHAEVARCTRNDALFSDERTGKRIVRIKRLRCLKITRVSLFDALIIRVSSSLLINSS